MKTLDTRDLYTRKCELESLRDAVTDAREELEEATETLANFNPERLPNDEEDQEKYEMGRAELEEAVSDAEDTLESAESDFGTDEQEELAELENLESEISDFLHGTEMIPEANFEDYARQFADDIAAIEGTSWPCNCIDWKQAAEELAMDYTSVTYQGMEYLIRA